MKVHGLICKKCFSQIFSRAGHDFRWCSCKSVAIDGGFSYVRIVGNKEDWNQIDLEVSQTKQELYDDWNSGADKYGLIEKQK